MSLKPQNDFKAFSISNNANVVSQERYEESRSLKNGFPPDNVTTHELNKVLRQSSTISSVVANFIATHSGGDDVLDDGDIAKLTAQLNSALEKKITTEIPSTSLTQKGIVQLTNKTGDSNTLAVTQKLASDINDNANNKLAKDQNGADIPDKNEFVKNLGLTETVQKANYAVPNSRKVNGKALTGDVSLSAGDVGAFPDFRGYVSNNSRFSDIRESGIYGVAVDNPNSVTDFPAYNGYKIYAYGFLSVFKSNDQRIHQTYYSHIGDIATRQTWYGPEQYKPWTTQYSTANCIADANGFLKRASPIVEIHPSGEFTTNEESEGAEVTKEGVGIYHISNVCGYNLDMAWGVHGGISVPKDNNNLELIFVDDRVQSDGSVIIETFHRQHTHLPTRFQNWRLKHIDENGERVFYKDSEPCDIPEHCRLDVRVQMPQDSIWNQKQQALIQDHQQ
ncbi:phage tail protein [Photorhabdus hindustanensis]|uniref:Phage tail protein n=1 Tax=Photorhabdus hindustanensis TaxID=2918802 RepID=A0A2S8Q198_9GAMM|nr:phage tail protein [Photorhabdus hindustanensis]PQQ25571.1 phage tail protein [Photorhabdus hindustanensis]